MAENAAENEDRQNHRSNHWPAAGAKIVMAMGRAPETSSGGSPSATKSRVVTTSGAARNPARPIAAM
jgi:hypothetical protein